MKSLRLPECIKSHNATICCLQEIQIQEFKYNDVGMLKSKEWEKYLAHVNQKKAGVAILIRDKLDFQAKEITRERGYNNRSTNKT